MRASLHAPCGERFRNRRLQVLALELLKILLENSGPVFRHSERFVTAIKQHLCLSLLKNGAGPVPQAQALSCSIFYTLLCKFRHSLKAEISVFFPMILLRSIEPAPGGGPASQSTTGGHRYTYPRMWPARCNIEALVGFCILSPSPAIAVVAGQQPKCPHHYHTG